MKLAIIRIRGTVNRNGEIRDTLTMLNLNKPNHCVIVEDTPSVKGMIKKVAPLLTWGPITDKTEKALEKRKTNKHYALNPPKKGYGRKGIKMPFKLGGSYGDRGEKINDLLERML